MSTTPSTFDKFQQDMFRVVSRVMLVGWGFGISWSFATGDDYFLLHLVAFLAVLASNILSGCPMGIRQYLLIASIFVAAVGEILSSGTTGHELLNFTLTVMLVRVMRGTREATFAALFCVVSFVVSIYLVIEGHVSIDDDLFAVSDTWGDWVFFPILLVITSATTVTAYSILANKFISATGELDKLVIDLGNEVETRKVIEHELVKSQEQYRLLERNLKDILWIFDLELKPIYMSPSVYDQCGYTVAEAMSQQLDEFVTEDTIGAVLTAFQEAITGITSGDIERSFARTLEYKIKRKDGSEYWVEGVMNLLWEGGKPSGIIGITRDISERKAAEAERLVFEQKMLSVQKMESLGLLAGGIAHDFNNLLVGILGNVDFARSELDEDSPMVEYLDDAIVNAQRAAELCHQLLAYSGRGRFLVQSTDIGKLVLETSQLLNVSVPKNISIQYQIDEELPPVNVDMTQMRQVFMNLVINAADAIGTDAGKITFKIRLEDMSTEDLSLGSNAESLHEGYYIVVDVSDTGAGIESDDIQRVFDPFYTTKETGHGLGLAAVLGIVHGHQGTVKIASEKGLGSTFTIILPSTENKGPAISTRPEESSAQTTRPGVVLVVDDEKIIRGFVRRVAEADQTKVLEASNGKVALGILEEVNGHVDLVLLDLTMPVMNGEETLQRIRSQYPDLPVILSSGFSESENIERFGGDAALRFLQKPYRMAELRSIFREALNN